VERSVGWFIFLATVLLIFGFCYYLYNTAQRKGWFLVPARFCTYIKKGDGLKIGDPVVLMGFTVGQITDIKPMPPRSGRNVRVDFVVNQIYHSGATTVPYYSYVWNEGSKVKLNSTDFLGTRGLEITRGTSGYNIYATYEPQILALAEARHLHDPENWRLGQNIFDEKSNLLVRAWSSLVESNLTLIAQVEPGSIVAFHVSNRHRHIVAVWNEGLQRYQPFDYRNASETNAYELAADDPPSISDQLQAMVVQVQQALPIVLALTNQLTAVLSHAADATSNLNLTIAAARPLVDNFAALGGDLRGPGALGAWVLGTNGSFQLGSALTNVNSLLAKVDTNLNQLTDQVGLSLDNVANLTSNLNVQVQANSNLLWGISKTVMDSDDFIQGLKRHWLLRSAFKHRGRETNQPALKNPPPTKAK
jgi:ABC-type transporter Mla subunit MlaD